MGACSSASAMDRHCEQVLDRSQESFALPQFAFKRMDCAQDSLDHRDWNFRAAKHSKAKSKPLPTVVDLRPAEAFPIYDQGDIGSCTANALAAAFHFEQHRQGLLAFCPSRLFIYFNERAAEGDTSKDTGASLRDGMKVLKKLGVCAESQWPYQPSHFKERPPVECYEAAKAHRCLSFARVKQTLEELKACIAGGFPFVFGFQVFCDFMIGPVQKTGQMSFPPRGKPHGGHAVQACGYDDEKEAFVVRNSWGADWGNGGHFYMPYKFILHPKLCFDFWAILFVEGDEFPAEDPTEQKASVSSPPPTLTRAAKGGA